MEGHIYLLGDEERVSLISQARDIDAECFDVEACAASPGKYEGAEDLSLVVALDILSMSGADEVTGSTDALGHLARIGRCTLRTDSQGFKTAHVHADAARASEYLREHEREEIIGAFRASGGEERVTIDARDLVAAIDALDFARSGAFGWRRLAEGAARLLADALAEMSEERDQC